MTTIGIDYSMCSPAISILPPDVEPDFNNCLVSYLSEKKIVPAGLPNIYCCKLQPFASDEERFDQISEWALAFIRENAPGLCRIFIEDYAFGAKGRVFGIGENSGLLKHKLWKNGYDFTLVAPTVIKKLATGKGNARKEGMYDSFVSLTKLDLLKIYLPKSKDVKSPVSDVVDSFYICKYGYEVGKLQLE